MTDAEEYVGRSIGDYRLLRLLGKGTFGTVCLAEHLHDHSYAAVKVLHIPLTDHHALHMFLNEARTIRLRHPHIMPILDFGLSRHDDHPYLVMAYADGGTLRDRHPKGTKLSLQTIDTYVQQLASALQYAHNHRVIHRDIKPENMLVSGDGTVQLSDFGIAKISELASLSSQHKSVGTPAYTAPEQNQGKPCPASDQYALAIVVYEWLTGERPFQGSPLAVMWQHYKDAPPSLQGINPEVPARVEQVIFKALAKAPEDRFPSIMHFAEALHTAMQEDTLSTQPLPNLDTFQGNPSPLAPVVLADATAQDGPGLGIPQALGETPIAPQAVPTPLPGVDAPALGAKPIEDQPSSRPVAGLCKRRITIQFSITIALILCLVILLGWSGTILTFMTHPYGASSTGAPTNHPTSLASILAQATAGTPVLDDPLNAQSNNSWDQNGYCGFTGGSYQGTLQGHGYIACYENAQIFSNFAYQVQMTILQGNGGGLVFRDNGNNNYVFSVDADGTYQLLINRGQTEISSSSSVINTGLNTSNVLTVVARGNDVYLYVNRQFVATFNKQVSNSGKLGVLVVDNGNSTTVEYSNAKVWRLP